MLLFSLERNNSDKNIKNRTAFYTKPNIIYEVYKKILDTRRYVSLPDIRDTLRH